MQGILFVVAFLAILVAAANDDREKYENHYLIALLCVVAIAIACVVRL